MLLTLLTLFLSILSVSHGNELRIKDAQGLVDFSNAVNSGTSYYGTTVLLDDDISFSSTLSQQFQPIGISGYSYFNGTFDGQGHIISNLAISTSNRFAGLFGYSNGTTIKNTVLDSSCSVSNSFICGFLVTYTGGFIGFCGATDTTCNIYSVINMATVSFSGSTDYDIALGGIIGTIASYKFNFNVKNCVNYGLVEDKGNYYCNHIGGVMGSCGGDPGSSYIQNCANFGTIAINGISGYINYIQFSGIYMRSGGILGISNQVTIENCLSAGDPPPLII